MSTNLLEMNHIKKQFDGLQVLKDVSIHVEEGEVLSIIGPSGSGKVYTAPLCDTSDTHRRWRNQLHGQKGDLTENGKVCMPSKNEIKDIQSYFGLVFQNFNLFSAFYRQ